MMLISQRLIDFIQKMVIMWRQFSRQLFHLRPITTTACYYLSTAVGAATTTGAAGEQMVIGKEALMRMRKQTGYSYARCRKALVASGGEHNYEQAVRWLNEAAAREGWDKAEKLSTRTASQGLCGVLSLGGNMGVFVELNCETDFVARNADFKQLVSELTTALANHTSSSASKLQQQFADEDGKGGKLCTISVAPRDFRLADGRTAEEAIVAAVGKIGENLRLARATIVFSPSPKAQLIGQTHPKEDVNGVQVGRFVSLVALEAKADKGTDLPLAQLGQQLCQHIIGMVPESLGVPGKKRITEGEQKRREERNYAEKQPYRAEEKEEMKAEIEEEEEDELNRSDVDPSELTRMDADETQLLHQTFMLCPQQTVAEYVDFHGATVTDFMRVELGQEQEH